MADKLCQDSRPTGQIVLHVHAQAHASPERPQALEPSIINGAGEYDVASGSLEESNEGLTFDEVLTKYVGEFGKGQILVYLWASLLQIPSAVLILLLVFALGDPVADRAWKCTALQPEVTDPGCWAVYQQPTDVTGFCSLSSSQWMWTNPHQRLVSCFNMICADSYKSQIANSFFFVGYLIGSGVFGSVADAYGRKGVTFGATLLCAVFTAAALGAQNYWVLLVLRLLTGVGVAAQALGSYLLATEMIGPSWRGVMGIIVQVFFIVGEFSLVIIALAFNNWRSQFLAAAVLCLSALLLWPLVPESGRWLQVQGRTAAAMQVLESIARVNGSQLPPEPLMAMSPPHCQTYKVPSAGSEAAAVAAESEAAANKGKSMGAPVQKKLSMLTALRSNWHIARRFFILAYAWLVMCMAYYGISFALGSLGGSLLVSFSISAIAELPSYLLAAWAIEHIGRHNTVAAGMLLGGGACIGCALMPAGPGRAGLAAVGKFGISASFGVAYIYTSELFPTLIRSAALGYQNQAARVGGIVAPFIVMAGSAAGGSAANLIPFLTFGIASIIAGLLIFTLPETLGVPLPDTLQDMDNIASVFTHKTWQTSGLVAATKSMFKARVVGNFSRKPIRRAAQTALSTAEPAGTHRQPAAQQLKPAAGTLAASSTLPHEASNGSQTTLLITAAEVSAQPF